MPTSSGISAKYQMSPEAAPKWRQNGVKMAKRGGNGFFEQKTNKTDIEKKYGGDVGLLCLLDSLMISANYRTSSQVAQKWRNLPEMAVFKEKS